MPKYLIDTSIWIDLLDDRYGHNKEHLGNYAAKLLGKITKTKSTIIITDFLLKELLTYYPVETVRGMFLPFRVEKYAASRQQILESEKIANERCVPRGDALFAIVARDCELVLVTRDRHFKKLDNVCRYNKPEEII